MISSFSYGIMVAGESGLISGPFLAWEKRQPITLVLYCHGGSSNAIISSSNVSEMKMINSLSEEYLVGLGDFGNDSWGNDNCQAKMEQFVSWVKSNFNIKPRIILVGASMGFASAIQYAFKKPSEVKGIAGAIPLTDLSDIYGRGFSASIDAAYGGTYVSEVVDPIHSPIAMIDKMSSNLPIKLFTSSNDTLVVPATSDAYVAARPQTDRVNLGAVGHSAAVFDTATVPIKQFIDSLPKN